MTAAGDRHMARVREEEWRDVPGFGDNYSASTLGHIRAKSRVVIKRNRHGGISRQIYQARDLHPSRTDKWGHASVHLGVDGRKFTVSVHHLVLITFSGPRPDGMEACHNNGDASDNRPENLRWDTHFNNNQDRKNQGNYAVGEAHHMAKFPVDLIRGIRSGSVSRNEAIKVHGMSPSHWWRVMRGDSWSHL